MTSKPSSIPQVLSNIGCQDLLTEEYTQCGWLRKKHFISKTKLFRWPQVYVVLSSGCLYYFRNEYSDKPSGKFSLYGYNSVHRAAEIDKGETQWAFKIIHTYEEEYKTYFFSASSEKEMKKWMRLIKAELIAANGQQGKEENYYYTYRGFNTEFKETEEDKSSLTYQDIEKDIYDDMSKFRRPKNYGVNNEVKKKEEASDDEDLPEDSRKSNASNISSDSGYRSSLDRPPQPLPECARPPPIPERPGKKQKKKKRKERQKSEEEPGVQSSSTESSLPPSIAGRPLPSDRPTHTGPTMASGLLKELSKKTEGINVSEKKTGVRGKPLPDLPVEESATASAEVVKAEEVDEVDDDTYWESIYFRDSNNEKGNEIIRHIAEDGVYLVREGATGGHVLVVFANNMPKKYRVQQSDNQYFLGRDGPHCDSLEELLYEYYSQNLPTVNVKLNTPYKLHQKYKTFPKK